MRCFWKWIIEGLSAYAQAHHGRGPIDLAPAASPEKKRKVELKSACDKPATSSHSCSCSSDKER
jgi:hypothetical protein